ncbi:Vacuolar protein-sorting-associated protein 24 [Madurella fahalii]|uniref:Vacuolar protein-sorting-associated protein 24 n=1 Tax=Madurella fahalii TaxID=1157608 RepID=A0ABQ0GKW3_9PEZI
MVGESLPGDDLVEMEEETAEGEVDKVLGEILKGRLDVTGKLPVTPIAQKLPAVSPLQEEGGGRKKTRRL